MLLRPARQRVRPLAENHDDDARWAFGTGFADPLAGVDTAVPDGVDAAALAAYCLMLGDDALVTSHRLQQWITRAPELEEEIALANIALDLLGQARLLLDRGPSRPTRVAGPRRGRAGVLPRRRTSSATSGSSSAPTATSPQLVGAAARRSRRGGSRCSNGSRGLADPVLAAIAGQGRQGARLPPRLRGAVGRARSATAPRLSPAACRPRSPRSGRMSTSCS